jgi:phosphoglycolate phosphatase-like HAD superfamily hydrolase
MIPFADLEIEIVNPNLPRGRFHSVLFDFDGTISLIREGWPEIMIPMMVAELQQTGTRESESELKQKVETFVMRLTGRQTIYQMMQLAAEIKARGGTPREPVEYKHQYHDLLMQRIQGRLDTLASGQAESEQFTVPGTHDLLHGLNQRRVQLYLASGTDLNYVQNEARLLGVTPFFNERIYGALDQYQNFSKKMIVEKILRDNQLQGEELLGFGDGYVEIEEIKKVGGVAIGVASNEATREGVDPWKRQRLIDAGADVIIPHYRRQSFLLDWLFDANR